MNYYYITGASKGVGKALAELLLEVGDKVIGISRTCSIEHNNYTHVHLDLSNPKAVARFKFEVHNPTVRVVLVNNAGMLGEMKHLGSLTSRSIIQTYALNVTAPAILTNAFIKTYKKLNAERIILNMSSGASHNVYDGWSLYCSSKSAVDMLSKVADREFMLDKNPFRIMSVAPGIIGTDMQVAIRTAGKKGFSMRDKFEEYHQNGLLKTPYDAARELLNVIDNPSACPGPVFDIRSLE